MLSLRTVLLEELKSNLLISIKPDLTEAVTVNIEFLGRLDPDLVGKKSFVTDKEDEVDWNNEKERKIHQKNCLHFIDGMETCHQKKDQHDQGTGNECIAKIFTR